MTGEGLYYDNACAVAAEITNLFAADYTGCKAELFSRILFLVLDAMYAARADVTPSEN